jgi:hypothetical protein
MRKSHGRGREEWDGRRGEEAIKCCWSLSWARHSVIAGDILNSAHGRWRRWFAAILGPLRTTLLSARAMNDCAKCIRYTGEWRKTFRWSCGQFEAWLQVNKFKICYNPTRRKKGPKRRRTNNQEFHYSIERNKDNLCNRIFSTSCRAVPELGVMRVPIDGVSRVLKNLCPIVIFVQCW